MSEQAEVSFPQNVVPSQSWIPSPPESHMGGSPQPRISPVVSPASIIEQQLLNPTRKTSLGFATKLCSVPGCRRPFCDLRTHRQYAQLILLQKHKSPHKKAVSDVKSPSSAPGWPNLLLPSPEVGRDGVDGFPCLPLRDQLNPELRELFHHFFNDVFTRLVPLFRAPPIPKDFKQSILSIALTNSAYCMSLIAHARIDNGIARDQYTEDRKSLAMYGKLLEIYREHLIVVQPAQVDVLLFVIVILLQYDMIHGRSRTARIHWNGMQQLISFKGGIHNVGVSLAYVMPADRIAATFNNKPPAYPLPADRSIQLMRPPKYNFGAAFEEPLFLDGDSMSRPVLDFCLDTCRLLELFESTNLSYHLDSGFTGPLCDVEYFYYSRDRLDGQFPILHAELHGQDSKEQVVLLTARIIDYPITWSNYIPTLTSFLCKQLQKLLEKQEIISAWTQQFNVLSTWSKDLHVLSWILFGLAIAPPGWAGRSWVITALEAVLSAKYDVKEWPENWRVREGQNARRFVWSDKHMKVKFHKVCDELEAMWPSTIPPVVENVNIGT